jgi:hypothetical protein
MDLIFGVPIEIFRQELRADDEAARVFDRLKVAGSSKPLSRQ